ncbi:hypothetical protein ACIP1T_25960 [Pseudomonas japonica]|uniref:hypothetical protein n=1 Tax=Pseudomonas japonica TaxID=256466 RepID=UPI003821E5B9
MGWDRKLPERTAPPTTISMVRWTGAVVVCGLACVSLFLLHASQRVPHLQMLNVWVFSLFPLLIAGLAFAIRAYIYGGALEHHQFLEEEAQAAQHSWDAWSRRYMAVHDSCLLLPDRISAARLMADNNDLQLRTGTVRRLSNLPQDESDRVEASLLMLLEALAPSLNTLALGSALQVTLISDVEPRHHGLLADAWRRVWRHATDKAAQATLTQVSHLSYEWLEDRLKTASQVAELIVVLQVSGAERYSDALAALLLCPDHSPLRTSLPVKARLLRPMPLEPGNLADELNQLLISQSKARLATGVVADKEEWHAIAGEMFAAAASQGGSLDVGQMWIQESFCGLSGPFSNWLVAALGVELAQHRQAPLLVLTKEERQSWVCTVDSGEEV